MLCNVLVPLLKLKLFIVLPLCVNVIPCPLFEFKINAEMEKLAFVTFAPIAGGSIILIVGAMQLSNVMVIVSESVPHELVEERTSVLTPALSVKAL